MDSRKREETWSGSCPSLIKYVEYVFSCVGEIWIKNSKGLLINGRLLEIRPVSDCITHVLIHALFDNWTFKFFDCSRSVSSDPLETVQVIVSVQNRFRFEVTLNRLGTWKLFEIQISKSKGGQGSRKKRKEKTRNSKAACTSANSSAATWFDNSFGKSNKNCNFFSIVLVSDKRHTWALRSWI